MKTGIHTIIAILLFTLPLASVMVNHHAEILKGRYGAFPVGTAEMADDMRAAGVSSTIRLYRWGDIEIEQDSFDFSLVDYEYYDVLKPNGLDEIMLIRTGQCWATDNEYDSLLGVPLYEEASAPPLDYDDYYDFVYNLVDHFKGEIEDFIIENDPITKYTWYGTPVEYKQLVSVAYQAAKDANPDCTIIGIKFPAMVFAYVIAQELYDRGLYQAAINFWNGYYSRRQERFQVDDLDELLLYLESDFGIWAVDFTNQIMMADHAENLDLIGFNYYLHYDYIDEVVGWLNYKMTQNGYHRPLIDLEHGVKDERGVVSDSTGAQELIKGYSIIHSLGIQRITWYPFSLDTFTHNYYILKMMYDLTYNEFRPPYYAMRTFTDQLSNLHFFYDKQTSPYSRYYFKDLITGLVDLEIFWSDAGDTTLFLPFPDNFDQAIITNYLGDSADTIPSSSDSIVIDVGVEPVFLKWIQL